MKNKIEYINSKLPLIVNDLIWEEPLLNICGENWRFNARTEWRLVTNDKVVVGCYDKDSNVVLKAIENLQIVSIYSQSKYFFDPVFIFENGDILEIFSSSTTEETWTLCFKDDNVFIESNE
ncbi:hypothetical protein [Flavobacterium sp. N2270]|uniref:hypothetical protein n=1 Tax=Flavobacterium sp. N2270 TaxID=2986831 RepID=UPI00222425DB|nr:hypothetical protein [Flavobacterium sp. N2270]